MWQVLLIVLLIALFLLGGLLAFKALGNWGMPDKLPPPLKDDAWRDADDSPDGNDRNGNDRSQR